MARFYGTLLFVFLALFGLLASLGIAAPAPARSVKRDLDDKATTFSLVNATPYRLRKGYCHSYQLKHWCNSGGWLDYLEPGQSIRFDSERHGGHVGDSAGEVVYHLQGTSKPMSFMYEQGKGQESEAYIHFLEELETIGNPKGSELNLGIRGRSHRANFIISGTEGDFYSTNSPTGWMSSLYEEIEDLPLREIVMPRSHHAGLYKAQLRQAMGMKGNSQTQVNDLEYQLSVGGIRVLDVRAFSDGYQTYESHGSNIIGMWHGIVGASLKEMIWTVNDWQDRHPGELIIWDVHETSVFGEYDGDKLTNIVEMREPDRLVMYEEFKYLKNRLVVPDDIDLTQLPLSSFVDPGTSGVLVRFHQNWVDKGDFPGGKEGFVSHTNFPYNHHWSNKGDTDEVTTDQIEHMKEYRPQRASELFVSDWLVTQIGVKAVIPVWGTIMDMNRATYTSLFHELWDALNDETYPNWIAMDAIRSTELKDIAVAMNQCLAARKCGALGGKVKVD